MGQSRETIEARLGLVAGLLFVLLIGGVKAILILSFLCVSLALLGYGLFRYIQENAVSVDDEYCEYPSLVISDYQPEHVPISKNSFK